MALSQDFFIAIEFSDEGIFFPKTLDKIGYSQKFYVRLCKIFVLVNGTLKIFF